MWEYIKEIKEIHQYFPDYTQKQLPERDYLFAVVSTLQSHVLDSLVSDAIQKEIDNWEPRNWGFRRDHKII